MKYHFLLLFLCWLYFFTTTVSAKTESELIQEYLRKLENSSYDKRLAPEGKDGANSPVDVNVTLYVLDISKVDDREMYFDAQLYFRQAWVDPRLQYTDKISNLVLNEVDKIWTPDLFFVNEREGSLHKIIHPNIYCRINPSGEVRFTVRISERFRCSMDLRKYPLDIHNCAIIIESYGFNRKFIELRWAENTGYNPVGIVENITAIDFDVINFEPYRRLEFLKYGAFSVLELTLTLKRKAGFFASKLYAPFIVLVSLSWLSLWMAAKERYLRLALLLVILYLMVNISTELNHKFPEAPCTKASDVWIGFCEALVFATFLEFIAVCILIGTETSDSSSSRACEIELNLDPESKEQSISTESLQSPLNKVMTMFVFQRGGHWRNNKLSHSVDRISRVMFPIIFLLFNIAYWSVYSS